MPTLQRIKTILFSEPAVYFAVVILTYGIFIPWYTLYGDDWIYLYAYHLQGAPFFIDFVAPDRPFSAWIYILATTLFNENYLLYHVLLLVLRWLSAVLLFQIMVLIWPKHREKSFWIALLFLVYPGFLQQPIPLQFILHFGVLDLFLFSILAMVYSIHAPERKWYYLFAALIGSSGMFSVEYFFGLELLRPLIIYLALPANNQRFRERLRQVMIIWLPYLALLAGFLVWRVFIFEFKHYKPVLLSELSVGGWPAFQSFIIKILEHFKIVTFGAWRQIFRMPASGPDSRLFYLLILAGLVLVLFYARYRFGQTSNALKDDDASHKSWDFRVFLFGVAAMVFGGIPVWVVGLPLDLTFPWDRSTLPFMLGSVLILASVTFLVIQKRFQRMFLAIAVAFSIGFHYQNALVYRDEAQELRSYFWQLSWRVPGLKQDTIVLADDIPLYRFSDNGLTPILNWMYAPELKNTRVPYKLFELTGRLAEGMPLLERGVEISHPYRGIRFTGNTSNSLVVYYHPPACLRVLDSSNAEIPDLPENILNALTISDLDRISMTTNVLARPPKAVGKEPEHSWCYSFQAADLAKQEQNWDKIALIWDDAVENKFTPEEPTEYFPFIEGFARLGKIDTALQISNEVIQQDKYRNALCSLWDSLLDQSIISGENLANVSVFLEQSGCQ